MIRNPLGLRLDGDRTVRERIQQAARLGARGVVLEATGELAPHRLGQTGRRDLKHLLRSLELSLIALHLPTRRTFDTLDQLDDRVRRADSAFAMAFELGTRTILVRLGPIPAEDDAPRRETLTSAAVSLAQRCDHRGVRLANEADPETIGRLRGFLDGLNQPPLAASVDPTALLGAGVDPIAAIRDLNEWVAHAYAGATTIRDPRGAVRSAGSLDWEEYVGALEEIGYHGALTVWPDPSADPAAEFKAVVERVGRIS